MIPYPYKKEVLLKFTQHLMNQETADQGWPSLPGNHMMHGTLEKISAIANINNTNITSNISVENLHLISGCLFSN